MKKIQLNKLYSNFETGEEVEVIEFSDIQLKDDSYQNELQIVVYVNGSGVLRCLQIDEFACAFIG